MNRNELNLCRTVSFLALLKPAVLQVLYEQRTGYPINLGLASQGGMRRVAEKAR